MNILQIIPELNTGGVETGTVDLAKELIRCGHKAVVISNGGRLVKDLVDFGGIHYQLPVHEKSPFTIISMISRIREIIKKENIDIVHARSRVPALSSFFAAHQSRVVFITTCHGYYSRHIMSRPMGWGKLVIVASNVVARHMIEDFKVPRQRIRLIPRGTDLETFQYNPPLISDSKKEYTIGIIGRITPIKGHVYLIRAISKVVRLLPNVRLLIIGDGPVSKPKYRQELEVLVRRLSLSKYINFLGQRNDIPKQLSRLDLLVMPSIGQETFGRVIIEAQATGVPVIASKVGGIIDIIRDNENGVLVPPRDWNALSEAIVKLLKDSRMRERLAKAARVCVERDFTLSDMYKKTIKVYNEALLSYNIVLIKWSALGDIILSLPALKAIREKFPKANIVLVTSMAGRDLLSRYGYVDDFFIFKNESGAKGIKEVWGLSSELRKIPVDLAVDMQNNKKSHIISFLSYACRRIGYRSNKLDFLMNEAISGARAIMSPVAHQFRLLEKIGISLPRGPFEFRITEEEKEYAEKLMADGWIGKKESIIGINCGASKRWQSKRYPTEKFAKLCDLFAQNKIRVVLTGSRDDSVYAKKILMFARSKPYDITGRTTTMQLAAVIKRCKVFITSDSAPMHIAAFSRVPFVALFGPTDPARHIESYGNCRTLYKKIKCSPCYKPKCNDARCMSGVMPEEIAAAATELIGEAEGTCLPAGRDDR